MVETKPRNRRQVVEEARRASLEGDWETAIAINRELIERDPKDSDAYNRLGRAYLEYRDYHNAYEAYSNALKIDPANLISRRNLQRLEYLRTKKKSSKDSGSRAETTFPRTFVFIEEVGKTWVDELVNPAPMATLAEIYAGQQLKLEIDKGRLIVKDSDRRVIGEVEAKTAERIIEMMSGGNLYEVYALGPSAASIRVILREVHRDPSQAGKISFPRQIAATRRFLRERDQLRLRDEADFYLEDEEAEEEDAAVEASEAEDEDVPDSESEDILRVSENGEDDATAI